MILTITLNPLLEKVLFFKKIEKKKVNRSYKLIVNAGGKGINVSRQLNQFKIDNLATGFLGGDNGKKLKSILFKEHIKNSFQQIDYETREGFVIVEDSVIQESYFTPDPIVTSEEVNQFLQKASRAILNSEMVVFSGSSPVFKNPEDEIRIFSALLKLADDNDKITLIDVYGNHLSEVLKLNPRIVHTNLDEMQSSLKISLSDEKDILEFLKDVNSKGIKIFIITNGDKNSYAINHGYLYEIIPPKIESKNSTGSGDAFMAGFIYALHNNLPFEEMLRWAAACGTANASQFEVCSSNLDLVNSFYNKVEIKKLN